MAESPHEDISRKIVGCVTTKTHTPTARRVTSPIHESCTASIVGVAKGTSAMISDSDVKHLADSFQGLPDAHKTVKYLTPKSKVGWHRWTLGWGNLVQAPRVLRRDDTTRQRRCQTPALRACHPAGLRRGEHRGRVGFDQIPVGFFPGMAGHPCLTLRATSLALQGEPADIGKG